MRLGVVPLFYLHLLNGGGWVRDPEGRDLPDLDAAKKEALAGARDLMASEVKAGELRLDALVAIEDEHGDEVYRLRFADAVTIAGG